MTSIADGSLIIQTSAASVPAPPSWFGEVVLMARHLRQQGVLTKMSEQVRFARRRFGHYELIDFLAILFGYARRFERTLETFYERLQPFAVPFMAQVSPRSVALPLGALTLFGSAYPGARRCPAPALCRGSHESPALIRQANRRSAGSSRSELGGLCH
jgi:hypothetical protein